MHIFTTFGVMERLKVFGNIPITTAAIASLYPELVSKNQKVAELKKKGVLIRLKKGMYLLEPKFSGKTISELLVANVLYGPSYLSMESALWFYGLIPEAVFNHTSITTKHSRNFTTPLGTFRYLNASPAYASIGVQSVVDGDNAFIIARPEKALCDLIVYTPYLNLRYRRELLTYLEDDIRFDMDAFYSFRPDTFDAVASLGKKSTMLRGIAKLLKS